MKTVAGFGVAALCTLTVVAAVPAPAGEPGREAAPVPQGDAGALAQGDAGAAGYMPLGEDAGSSSLESKSPLDGGASPDAEPMADGGADVPADAAAGLDVDGGGDPDATAADPGAKIPQPTMIEQAYAVSMTRVLSPSEKTSDAIVLPSGRAEVGGELVMLTSDRAPWSDTGTGIDFTDTMLARLRARHSFSDWLELFAGTELLAKQPVDTDEPPWQGAMLGARIPFAEHFAVQVTGAGGPLLDDAGWWWQTDGRLQAKVKVARYLRFVADAGNAFTALELTRGARSRASLDEVVLGGEAQLFADAGALWARADYSIPVASTHDLDPQIRLDLDVGGVLTMDEDGWDIYVLVTFIDRGDLARPATTLPILDGGFDQQQIVLGIAHRFGKPADRAH